MCKLVCRGAAWFSTASAIVVLWAPQIPIPGGGRLDGITPFAALVALRPALAVLLTAVAAGWLLSGRLLRGRVALPAIVLLAAGLAACAQIVPRAIAASGARSGDGVGVTVLVANAKKSNVAPATIASLVTRTRARVIALPEVNAVAAARYVRALEAATTLSWVTWTDARGGRPTDLTAQPTSIVVEASLRPRRLPVPPQPEGAHGMVRVGLTVRGTDEPLALSAVHPRSPRLLRSNARWRDDLAALRPLCRAGDVVAGDLNATPDHSLMRALHAAGCRSAAVQAGEGLRATWTGGPFGFLRPMLDHVLTSGRWTSESADVLPLPGSDHRAVVARIVPGGDP